MKAIDAKIVLLGSQGVGKTTLVSTYVTRMYTKDCAPTIGATFFSCRITINDVKIKMEVWDTAGQERFRSMAPMYYRNANAALLIFDLTKYNTFQKIKTWVTELQRNVQNQMVLTLVGNKSDLHEERAVSREEAQMYATSIGGIYHETSSLTNHHSVEKVFAQTALGLVLLSDESNSALRRYDSHDSLPSINLGFNAAEAAGTNELPATIMSSSMISIGMEPSVDGNVNSNSLLNQSYSSYNHHHHQHHSRHNEAVGREEAVAFSLDHIALGDEHRSGCCW